MRYRRCKIASVTVLLLAIPMARGQALENAVIDRINAARQNPRQAADQLRDYRRHFDGLLFRLPGDPVPTLTREGTAAVDEAIAFLEAQPPLPPLERAPLLEDNAAAFARDQGAIGGRGHIAQDGASPGERLRRRGGDIYIGESIAYGEPDAESLVRTMIVDDGVPTRSHRTLLFGARFRYAGIGCSPHTTLDHICVIDMSATIDGSPVKILVPPPGP